VFGRPTVIFVQVELARHRAADFERFERAVAARPQIVEAWAVGGGTDYILRTETESVDAYQRLIDRLLAEEIGLSRYYSFVVTKPVKRSSGPLLPLDGEDPG
jgi:Lrp/AsnC family transcriptional regulator of ectoine degradation